MREEVNKQKKDGSSDQGKLTRRELIRRGGIYAAATPIVLATLMSPTKSHATSSEHYDDDYDDHESH